MAKSNASDISTGMKLWIGNFFFVLIACPPKLLSLITHSFSSQTQSSPCLPIWGAPGGEEAWLYASALQRKRRKFVIYKWRARLPLRTRGPRTAIPRVRKGSDCANQHKPLRGVIHYGV